MTDLDKKDRDRLRRQVLVREGIELGFSKQESEERADVALELEQIEERRLKSPPLPPLSKELAALIKGKKWR